jgi:hypothetical protein
MIIHQSHRLICFIFFGVNGAFASTFGFHNLIRSCLLFNELSRSSNEPFGYVGYLIRRFEYFPKIFAYRLDQVRPTLDQDRTR